MDANGMPVHHLFTTSEIEDFLTKTGIKKPTENQ